MVQIDSLAPRIHLLIKHAPQSIHCSHQIPYHAMTLSYLSNFIFLFLSLCSAELVDFTGNTITTRFWDCCKPSCSWKGKAGFSQPVQTCAKDESYLSDFSAGTGCKGGKAYSCSDQQPWAVNDTFSYGFAGIFIQGHVEDFWCCACYRLDFTSEPLLGKSMIIQASNTAYDVSSSNRFSLAVCTLITRKPHFLTFVPDTRRKQNLGRWLRQAVWCLSVGVRRYEQGHSVQRRLCQTTGIPARRLRVAI